MKMSKRHKNTMVIEDDTREMNIKNNLAKETKFWGTVPASVPLKGIKVYKSGADGKFRDDAGNIMEGKMREVNRHTD